MAPKNKKIESSTREEKIALAEKEAQAQLVHLGNQDGVCHEIWRLQKKILKEKYQIEWESPADQHPGKRYD
jgi:type IV secretory pathway VirD2 relaxase